MNEKKRGIIHPQLDELGYETGLWRVYEVDEDFHEELVYENVDLRISHNGVHVGQIPDWDGSYDKHGYIPDSYDFNDLGVIEGCPNPFMDYDASTILLNFLENSEEAVPID